jgi:signal transduction histidine kinase
MRYDPALARPSERTFSALIRRVSEGNALIFGGEGPLPERPGEGPVLPFTRGALRFEFASPSFDLESASQYQVRLDGYDHDWSPWTPEPQKEYTNLAEGRYRFQVRARDIYGQVSQGQSFRFRILPPWYRTGWAILLFGGLTAVVGATGVRLWTGLLRRRNLALQQRIDRATEELRERERLLASQAGALERMNAQLVELNEQKNQFLAIVAHDLRNPLTSILLSSQLIGEDGDIQVARRRAGMIAREGSEMETLIGRFLDLSALDSGGIKTEPGELSIPDLLEGLLPRFEPGAKVKGIALELEIQPPEGRVFADAKFVSAVLDNLISNAIKFSPPGTTVAIRVEDVEQRVRVSVRDQGPGLTEADQKRLFGRFARLSAQPTGGEKSVGLGLSIAKQMVEACGGRIWVESEPGKGATFVVEFPRSEA